MKTRNLACIILFIICISFLCTSCSNCVNTDTIDTSVEKTSYATIAPTEEVGSIKTSGFFYENTDTFVFENPFGESSELSEEYLKSIKYRIETIDTDSNTAMITVFFPVISSALEKTFSNLADDISSLSYDELLAKAKDLFAESLSSSELEYTNASISLPIERSKDEIKLVLNDEWNELIIKHLEDAYIDYLKLMIGGMTND